MQDKHFLQLAQRQCAFGCLLIVTKVTEDVMQLWAAAQVRNLGVSRLNQHKKGLSGS